MAKFFHWKGALVNIEYWRMFKSPKAIKPSWKTKIYGNDILLPTRF